MVWPEFSTKAPDTPRGSGGCLRRNLFLIVRFSLFAPAWERVRIELGVAGCQSAQSPSGRRSSVVGCRCGQWRWHETRHERSGARLDYLFASGQDLLITAHGLAHDRLDVIHVVEENVR